MTTNGRHQKHQQSKSVVGVTNFLFLFITALFVLQSFVSLLAAQSCPVVVPNQQSPSLSTTSNDNNDSQEQRQTKTINLKFPDPIPLDQLTAGTSDNDGDGCTNGLYEIENIHNVTSHDLSNRRIPKIIHQTAKNRCVTGLIYNDTLKWKLPGYSYYFHDDAAMLRLFEREFAEFPQLQLIVQSNCMLSGTIKADFWRYLVLWVYGGVYADIDTAPSQQFTASDTIQPEDDAFFVVEKFELLSQYFLAASPRHPLLWHALYKSLHNLMDLPDTGKVGAARVSGPHALHKAYKRFRADAGFVVTGGTKSHAVYAGRFVGTHNRSITVAGNAKDANGLVERETMGRRTKKKEYARMDMTHFKEDKEHASGESCASNVLKLYYNQLQPSSGATTKETTILNGSQ